MYLQGFTNCFIVFDVVYKFLLNVILTVNMSGFSRCVDISQLM